MLDFSLVDRGEGSLAELAGALRVADLHALTDEMIDRVRAIIADVNDVDVVFVPTDGTGAAGWTLSELLTHVSHTSDEAAAFGSMLARGIALDPATFRGRRHDTLPTVADVQARLAESRRMRHALFDSWPNDPDYATPLLWGSRFGTLNAPALAMFGLYHAHSHLEQIQRTVAQAKAARR